MACNMCIWCRQEKALPSSVIMGMLDPVVTEAWRTKPCTGLLSGDDLSIPGGVKPGHHKKIQISSTLENNAKGGRRCLYSLYPKIIVVDVWYLQHCINIIVYKNKHMSWKLLSGPLYIVHVSSLSIKLLFTLCHSKVCIDRGKTKRAIR